MAFYFDRVFYYHERSIVMKRTLSILLSLAMAFAATGSLGKAEMLKQKEPVLAAVSEDS